MHRFIVNSALVLYLTDFLGSIFGGENAKNFDFCGGEKFKIAPVYHRAINYDAPLEEESARVT